MTREQGPVSAGEGVRLGPQAALIKLIGETPNPKDQKLLFSTRAAIAQAIIDAGWRPPTSASEPQTEEHNQSPRPPKGGSGVTPPRRLAEPRDAIQDYYQ